MPSVSEISTRVGTQVIEAVRRAEDAIVEAVKGLSESAPRRVPEIKLPIERLPDARAAVNAGFGIAQQALEAQREFVLRVLDAVGERLGVETDKTAKPSAKKASPKTATPTAGDESA